MARSSCLYCGAALPAESVAAAADAASKVRESSSLVAGAATAPAKESEGQLLVVDVGGAKKAALERALGLPRFEAEMRLRRGGLQLHRRGSEGELRDEAKRLEAAGLPVFLVAEA
ncbi:MAG TPA: hypothetical protein VMV21_13905, partial [Vicinamibacteria bacterium]|nr:hypothetical protein [Vicinamibacteria bacterium]